MKRRRKPFKLIAGESDFTVLALTTALVIFGVVMIFSASYYNSINSTGSPYSIVIKQFVYAIIGFGLMYFTSKMDYHFWRPMTVIIVPISIALLLLLFTPFGTTVNGATRWIIIGPLSIMPGEIAKFSAIIFTASFISAKPSNITSFTRGILPLGFFMVLVCGLIMLQPNMSIAITVAIIIAGMMFVAGLPWIYVGFVGGVSLLGIVGLIIADPHGYRLKRVTSFMDPFANALGDAFQVVQSLLALGSGGLFGLGIGKSVQKTLYLPEPHNDFILSIIGEELGLIGIMILMTAYVILIWRGIRICLNAPDMFGMLLSGGIVIMLGFQVIINVAVVTSSMPPTGITLPFVSYGGNALWIFMACMGILLNISKKRKRRRVTE